MLSRSLRARAGEGPPLASSPSGPPRPRQRARRGSAPMTLVELTGNAARNNALQWFHRTSGRPRERLRMLEDALALPAPEAEPVSAGAFVEQIEETIQEQSKREIMSVLDSEEHTSELQSLMRIQYAVF